MNEFDRASRSGDRARRAVRLRGLATALPELCWDQAKTARVLADLWRLDSAQRAKWQRIIDGSGVAFRHAVKPIEDTIKLTTAARMTLFEEHATALAANAAQRVLHRTGVDAETITDLIIVTCTGFSAPGIDVELVERMRLPRTVRRMQVGFMGCFGAITGLRAAHGLASAESGARVLVVCVELCSLHLRPTRDAESLVASALFADGAAAAVVDRAASPDDDEGIGLLEPGGSVLLPDTRDRMSWRITDHGFAMTLDPRVARELAPAVDRLAREHAGAWIVHPGGPRILDAIERALPAASAVAIEHARSGLRDCGNMSSPSVLFVLERALAGGIVPPVQLVAFGPGLTLDRIPLQPMPRRVASCAAEGRTAQVPAGSP